MPAFVLVAVLCAALLHAGWNAAIKAEPDKLLASMAVSTGAAALGAAALVLMPLPDPASWPFILASTALHVAYYQLLSRTYGQADISLAYPLMRGSAPVLVALASAWAEPLHPVQGMAVALVSLGAVAACFGGTGRLSRRAVGLALLTALVIAAYTLVDGLGVRRSGAPASYTAALFLLSGVAVPLACRRQLGGRLPAYLAARPMLALAGGLATGGSYAIVLWAMTQAPVAVVAALRETSIVFAVAIAAWVLRERVGRARVLGALLIAGGAATLRLA
ncbi:EamA family transporter [Massilia agri]|uniref:EamA family transporter n=1 Tax=Massilia agri TaxID=1886785 RepID=A0ABT2AQ22_9BURK|nr:EamA family transporter [Massilia agri]MCS0598326.1 EamA family transporter [Massilia agri]